MNRIPIFLLFLLTTLFNSSYSQISDNFSDGNITENPPWSGNTANFKVNEENQLQLNAPNTAGISYLSTASEIVSNAEWSFYLKLEFNPSSNNYIDVYLVSDQANLTGSLNGYFVRVGNTADEISLYRQSGEKSAIQKIIDGQDDRVDQSQVELKIKVTRNHTNEWELLVDADLTEHFISEGTVTDQTFYFSRHFGIVCNYTATRSDKIYIDSVSISGDNYVDTTVPEVDSLIVLSDSSLQLNFSEKMLAATMAQIDNYFVNNTIGNPMRTQILSDSAVVLFFKQRFPNKVRNQISIHNLSDLFGNKQDNLVLDFAYTAPYIIGFGDIIITEIMPDPTPGVDLPEYEYIEIHNLHSETFYLNDVKLIVGPDTTLIPNLTIEPKEYIILCQHAAVDQFTSHGKTVKISNWPSLNNRGEVVIILNEKDEVIHSIDYSESWYKSIEKDDGGYSLEMIDIKRSCFGEENWMASIDSKGGTPGKENSVKNEIIDVSAPEIDYITATSDSSINIHLSEGLAPQNFGPQDILLSPELEVRNIQLQEPGFFNLMIEFESAIRTKVIYELTLKNLVDCAGNSQKGSSSTFVLPEPADSLDLIINEILFNPRPGGVDFVEIYNQSEKYIDLVDISIGNDDLKPITSNHSIVKPEQFLVITENAFTLQNQYPEIDMKNVLASMNMPSFNNDEGNVYLVNKKGINLDFFHYEENYHSKFLNETEGISLERISYEGNSNDPNNWQSASGLSGYATPGQVNSQALFGDNEEEEISIDPKVFVPGNNGFHNFTTIKCRFPTSGNMASIHILDPTGRQIKTILSHRSIGSQDDFKWEGLDDNGQQVRMGPYIVHVEVYNVTGAKKLYRKKVVVGGEL